MPQATGPGLMGGWAPHQARILFPGQFSLEHLILGPLLLNCLFQSKYLCTQLQDLVLLSLHVLQQPCPLLVPLALFLFQVQIEFGQPAIHSSYFQAAAVKLGYGAVSGSCRAGQLLPEKGGFLLA